MKKIIQNYNTGELKLVEIPPPQMQDGQVLIKSYYSVISSGTEKTKIDTARKSLVGKAKSRPDLVKKVIEKAKKEGLWKTWQTVSQRLNTPISLGYSSAGRILDVAEGVEGLRRGDIVACGGEFANHAEIISVPKKLVVPVPEGVGLDHAAFATIGAIAMQGVRQAEVQLGEKVAVIGLGVIGLLVVQILKASGCQVIGTDLDAKKVAAGRNIGCDEAIVVGDGSLEEKILLFTDSYGVDSTIITASTKSNTPIEQAGEITREKGKVVVVGAVGMDIPREPYYLKEIDLRISRSYGPGRYDNDYEVKGRDYPISYVRFTEQRNMQCFLELVRDKQINLSQLITHTFPFEEATRAYDLIGGSASAHYLGIVLEYNIEKDEIPTRIDLTSVMPATGKIDIGVIGAGNYATANLLPYLKSHPEVTLGTICTATGMTAIDVAKKFGFKSADSDVDQIISESTAILVATRHNDHAPYALKALQQGRSVFVEKPLVLKKEELEGFIALAKDGMEGSLMVGFNRRFSPAVEIIQENFVSMTGPKQILIRVNAGKIPLDHWIQDPDIGGGRLIGEACHFVDLAVALTDASIETVYATAIPKANRSPDLWDDFCITLGMSDDSVVNIFYTSIGDSGFSKEYIEVFCGGRVGIIHDFKIVELWSNGKRKQKKLSHMDKGQEQQIKAWIEGLQKGESPIPFHEIINVHQACLAAIVSIKNREMIHL